MRNLEDGRPHVHPCYLHGCLVVVVVVAWGLMACGGGSKPPMQPDNDPAPAADGGADPAMPAPAPH